MNGNRVRDAGAWLRAALVDPHGWRVLVLLFLLSLPAVTTRLYASDEIQYFAFLRSLWFDHDLSFQNEYEHFYDRGIARGRGFHETFLELETPTGLRLNFGTIGSAFLWTPFYAAGDVAARVMRVAGSPIAADGFSQPYIVAITYGSAVYGFLAVVFSIIAARRLVGHGRVAAVLIWLGTPLVFYMYVAPGMAHACSAFAVAAFVLTWLRVRQHWSMRGVIGLGALAALMVMVREQDVLYVVGPMADFIWYGVERVRRSQRRWPVVRLLLLNASVGVLAALVVYLPQAFAYMALNGRLGPSQVTTQKMAWSAPFALQVLLSPEHGFLTWTPLAILGLAGLLIMARPRLTTADAVSMDPRVAVVLLLMVLGQVYVTGSVESWTVAGAFGQRRFVGLTVILVIGLAALFRTMRSTWQRRSLGVVIGMCVWWNLGLMAQFGSGTMDRQRLELRRNVYNTFIVVPRQLPQLAYRYLFDRQSFYELRDE